MDEIKKGARNSRMDKSNLQAAHAAIVAAGAECESMEEKNIDPEDMLVNFGSAVKALNGIKEPDYAIVYGGQDLTDDYFDKDTEYGFAGAQTKRVPILFHHAQPLETKGRQRYQEKKPIGEAELQITDEGVLITEAILYNREKYEANLSNLGWSTGAASHAVVREERGGKTYLKQWLLSELSITPTSAEPRLKNVVALKSLATPSEEDVKTQEEAKPAPQDKQEAEAKPESIKSIGDTKMELEDTKLQEMLTQAAEAGATKAIAATEPVKSSGGTIQVTVDEGDRPFKTLAAQVQAVKDYTISFGRKSHPRIDFLKAVQGASEGVPTDGGILLDPTLSPEVMKPIHQEGVFSADVRKLPVSNNSNSGWINGVDETDRATGSRWGGLRGYRLAEGDTVTKSKPKFRRINWELKKYGVLVYDTNELLKDAAQFSAIVEQGCREEIAFMLNDDIFNGLGVSGPLGVMQSPALIATVRVTASTIVGADISTMWQRLSLTSKAKAKWYVNSECAPQLDALFAVGSTAVLFPYAGYTPDGVRTLYGRPIVETEFNPALNASGDIALCDMSEYLLWEKGDVEMATSMHVEFLTDQEVIRFIYRCDGQPAAASPVTPYKGTLTHSPFVVMGAASA